jgi:hypothetical protein
MLVIYNKNNKIGKNYKINNKWYLIYINNMIYYNI